MFRGEPERNLFDFERAVYRLSPHSLRAEASCYASSKWDKECNIDWENVADKSRLLYGTALQTTPPHIVEEQITRNAQHTRVIRQYDTMYCPPTQSMGIDQSEPSIGRSLLLFRAYPPPLPTLALCQINSKAGGDLRLCKL